MRFFNLKNPGITTGFRDAVIRGLSPDMGLFMPERIPLIEQDFFRRLPNMHLSEIAIKVGEKYTDEDIPRKELERICEEAFNFPVVLSKTDDRKQSLELFHGPTAAFKDFGARFMAGCFRYFSANDNTRTVVLVATSGDTGGAIASSFLGVDNVDVIILYPSGKVSLLQENQLTTLGRNITALEVSGTFDDCQAMVKSALTTLDTNGRIRLTSANSINIARLIPQMFYYFYAIGQSGEGKVLSVPSGNFGNITAAAMAWKSGLAIKHLVAATNINRVVPDYLTTGVYTPAASLQTIANAMDVGSPNNFERFRHVFGNDLERMRKEVSGYWFDDDQIRQHIHDEYRRSGYILDPHGAVASMGLDSYLDLHPDATGIFVETAHPGKFTDVVVPLTGKPVEMPDSLIASVKGEKHSVLIQAGYSHLRDYITDRYLSG
jgi:threonine synthase